MSDVIVKTNTWVVVGVRRFINGIQEIEGPRCRGDGQDTIMCVLGDVKFQIRVKRWCRTVRREDP